MAADAAFGEGRGGSGAGWRWAARIGWLLLVLMLGPFALYAALQGVGGIAGDLPADNRFLLADATASNLSIFTHMITGAAITFLAPFQLVGAVRRRWPRLHRLLGRMLVALAIPTALGGLGFIFIRGTEGGWIMDLGAFGYGACVLVSAVETFRHARAGRFALHREWALRLFVLAIASWIYRMHYVLWYLATDGLWSNEDFTGAFDLVTIFAFYIPYLALIEVYIRATRPSDRATPATAR
ncbi:MAG: DUF2306 domain-containing protein [Pseudomonadota bacterium]